MINEQEKQKVLEIIRANNEGPSSLMQVLTIIQEEFGYLPMEVQKLVATELGVPFSRVYEVSSFYARFTTEPKGKNEILVCLGTACYVKGSQKILDELKKILEIDENQTTPDGLFTLITGRCIGACALAPAMIINKDVHGMLEPKKIPGILEMYK